MQPGQNFVDELAIAQSMSALATLFSGHQFVILLGFLLDNLVEGGMIIFVSPTKERAVFIGRNQPIHCAVVCKTPRKPVPSAS